MSTVCHNPEKNTLSFIETSALDSTNVEEAFKNILTGKKMSHVVCHKPPRPCDFYLCQTVTVFSPRNLPYCISAANIRQICARRFSRQQRSGHKRPPDHGRTEGQQAPLLSEPVILVFSLLLWLSVSLSSCSPLALLLSCCCQHETLTGSEVSDPGFL